MKRRDFLKDAGLITAGCTLGSIGTYKFIENKTTIKTNSAFKDKNCDWISHIEISLCYHCNLNCARCMHCSPIAPVYYMPLDIFEKDIARMSKITNSKIRNVMLLGGEPLLNKNIEEYIKITRKYFKNSQIVISTNGLLLNDMPEQFWQTCAKYNIEIWHTLYPLHTKNPNLSKSYQKAIQYKVILSPYTRYTFAQMNLDDKKQNKICETYKKCRYRIKSTMIDNGILYPCPVIFSTKLFLNKYFKSKALPISNNDFIDIYKLNSIAEFQQFLKEPKDFCKYCNAQYVPQKLWALSKKEMCEWFNI